MGPTNYVVYIPIYFFLLLEITDQQQEKALKHLVTYWHMQILNNAHGRRQTF